MVSRSVVSKPSLFWRRLRKSGPLGNPLADAALTSAGGFSFTQKGGGTVAWATTGEVLTYTGIEVSEAELQQAQFIVELFSDATEDANDNISSKNLRFLKMAVAYQAAFMTEHPDLFTHVDVSTMLQDGLQFVRGHENAFLLAPFARRAINRLSWKRNRSIKVKPSKRATNRGLRTIEYGGTFSSVNVDGGIAHMDIDIDSGTWEAE